LNGIAVRAIRRAQKMGLNELARRTGRSKGFLSKVERELTPASHETEQLIARALQVPPDAISRKEKP
jgi:transcriptional regulator with XRE-family HTH domain